MYAVTPASLSMNSSVDGGHMVAVYACVSFNSLWTIMINGIIHSKYAS